jgi:hypothetical protein
MTSKQGFHYTTFLFFYGGEITHSGVLDYDTVHYEGTSTIKMMSADPSETSVTTCHTLQEVLIQITLHYFELSSVFSFFFLFFFVFVLMAIQVCAYH